MDLITVAEMDALPDDPLAAFVQLERICRTRLNEYTNHEDNNDYANTMRIEYMTIVASAAQSYGVASFDLPMEGWNYREFELVYQRALAISTKLIIEGKRARALNSVLLKQGTKERIKKHLSDLRSAVSGADLSEKRKKILNDRLDDFEKELNKERTNYHNILVALTLISAGLNQATGVITGVEDSIIKLPDTVNAINVLLGKEKLAELEAAPEPLPLPTSVTKALPSPKSDSSSSAGKRPGAFDDDLDDDVPF